MILSWWRKLANKTNRSSKRALHSASRSRFFRRMWVEQLEDRTLLATFQWIGGSSVNWNDAGNWTLASGSGSFPNAQGDIAKFTASYSTAQSITVNQAITVGEIDYGTSRNVTITSTGTNALTLDNTGLGGTAILDVGQTNTNSAVDVLSAPLLVAPPTALVPPVR